MASSQRPDQRVVHQDYLARIRYSNALPPPPNPPKLLDIPGTGLAGGQYTSASYASKLAREQPLNIEADAELGMPIDLVGIPGIFDGDERAIHARPNPQALHPTDKLLLKPLGALGKGGASGAVSFLRRTEYTSSQGPQHLSSSSSKDLLRLRNDPKRRRVSVNKDSAINIAQHIVKGFDIAYPRDAWKGEDSVNNIRGTAISDAEARAWSAPKHPSNSSLELLDSYPVLPDLEALPSFGAYIVTKFQSNPTATTNTANANTTETYDTRLDAAILRPRDDAAVVAKFNQKKAEWDPASGKPEPITEDTFDFYLPFEQSSVRGIKRKLDVNDPENESEELYSDAVGEEGEQRAFKYLRVRTYETYNQHGDPNRFYDDSVALVLHDSELNLGAVEGAKQRLPKGAYFYPVRQRTALRPKRHVVGAMGGGGREEQEEKIDEINLTVGEPDDDTSEAVAGRRRELDGSLVAAA